MPSIPIPRPSQPIDPVTETTLEYEIHVDEQRAAMQKYPTPSGPYCEAYKYVEEYRKCYSQHGSTHSSYKDYMKPRSIKMSWMDWAKLSSDLGLSESDER
jgi:hypothetical protein